MSKIEGSNANIKEIEAVLYKKEGNGQWGKQSVSFNVDIQTGKMTTNSKIDDGQYKLEFEGEEGAKKKIQKFKVKNGVVVYGYKHYKENIHLFEGYVDNLKKVRKELYDNFKNIRDNFQEIAPNLQNMNLDPGDIKEIKKTVADLEFSLLKYEDKGLIVEVKQVYRGYKVPEYQILTKNGQKISLKFMSIDPKHQQNIQSIDKNLKSVDEKIAKLEKLKDLYSVSFLGGKVSPETILKLNKLIDLVMSNLKLIIGALVALAGAIGLIIGIEKEFDKPEGASVSLNEVLKVGGGLAMALGIILCIAWGVEDGKKESSFQKFENQELDQQGSLKK